MQALNGIHSVTLKDSELQAHATAVFWDNMQRKLQKKPEIARFIKPVSYSKHSQLYRKLIIAVLPRDFPLAAAGSHLVSRSPYLETINSRGNRPRLSGGARGGQCRLLWPLYPDSF